MPDIVLTTLYGIEERRISQGHLDGWTNLQEIAAALPASCSHRGDLSWVQNRLEDLWRRREVLQLPPLTDEPTSLVRAEVDGTDLLLERNDCRYEEGQAPERLEIALYSRGTDVQYRSRAAEIVRLLERNFQRFNMAPSTGMLRYVRFPQTRPERPCELSDFSQELCSQIQRGCLSFQVQGLHHTAHLRRSVDRDRLCRAASTVIDAVGRVLGGSARFAEFQCDSVVATLAGLYADDFRRSHDAHVVTAGVGSGKSYAFQVGALIHLAYSALGSERGLRVLMLYPRVALAANQFQDLHALVNEVNSDLGTDIPRPLLDAGGQLPAQFDLPPQAAGRLEQAIRRAYSGDFPLIITNLDTLANRLPHPEARCGFSGELDLVVLDEIHLLSGLYGAHAKMLLKRLQLIRAVRISRQVGRPCHFDELLTALEQSPPRSPYTIAASATIAEPCSHTARVLDVDSIRVLHLPVETPITTGWVHHVFLRQLPETSAITALVNATSCLVHNRRDGLFREYYSDTGTMLSLDALPNPIDSQPPCAQPGSVGKTLGFCDSLDGIGRWADLVADNERTKASSMYDSVKVRGGMEHFPYFVRFQEPLWRVPHHLAFAQRVPRWQQILRQRYGRLCALCKQGVRAATPRLPSGSDVTAAAERRIRALWNGDRDNGTGCYLEHLGVDKDALHADRFAPYWDTADSDEVGNLDRCPFFRCGLCWWWSADHAGSNVPSRDIPLNGVRQPTAQDPKALLVNGLRVTSFTSKTQIDALELESIDDIFRLPADRLYRAFRNFGETPQVTSFVVGSPRVEVGVDLRNARDGLTFRAMRDPASLQQKIGRLGRETGADVMAVHVVTETIRDLFYFRNVQKLLNSRYLQPIPMHEHNRVIACMHYFTAIFDFLLLQSGNPPNGRIADRGERIVLINDHSQRPSFANWERKVAAVYDFLFGDHPRQAQNLVNLQRYLALLGAERSQALNDGALLGPERAPLSTEGGAIDVFRHEFGPNLLQTRIRLPNGVEMTLSQACATHREGPPLTLVPARLPRHREFLSTYNKGTADSPPNPYRDRSYVWNLLTQPIFQRGMPQASIPGNMPYVWPENLFSAAGGQSVRVLEASDGAQLRELAYEPVSLTVRLLLPGTTSYRYRLSPRKVAVASYQGHDRPVPLTSLQQAVLLRTQSADWYARAECDDLGLDDLPWQFPGRGHNDVPVLTPRQVVLLPAQSEPRVRYSDGMLADDDSREIDPQVDTAVLPTPPRCYPLQWFRCQLSNQVSSLLCRFSARFSRWSESELPPLPASPVERQFDQIRYDPELGVTEFAWGMDRQYMNRAVQSPRLLYKDETGSEYVAIGQHYTTEGLVFDLNYGPGTTLDSFLDDLLSHPESPVYQACLWQVLDAFLARYATSGADPATPWLPGEPPSVFARRHLRTIVMFHHMERWHPQPGQGTPATPPYFDLSTLRETFVSGSAAYLDDQRFAVICGLVAALHGPADVQQHENTLRDTLHNLRSACGSASNLDDVFFRDTAREILVNSLAISMHGAALRVSGAEDGALGYFYKLDQSSRSARIFLFDSDPFGNGTTELVRRFFRVSAAERVLVERLRVRNIPVDPLPTQDFLSCLETSLGECDTSQAAQCAYHQLQPSEPWASDLAPMCRGERAVVGTAFDFLRQEIGLNSFDHVIPFRFCPEFCAHLAGGNYPQYPQPLLGTPAYRTFQALESALSVCTHGCVACLVTPETDIHGGLEAGERVNKLLLDAYYRQCVCGDTSAANRLLYPGDGEARTATWPDLATVVTGATGRELPGWGPALLNVPAGPESDESVTLQVHAATVAQGWSRVFRTSWDPAPAPAGLVRPLMTV